MSDIIVTGGTGFLGGALIKALVHEGHLPIVLVRRREAFAELAATHGPDIRPIQADLSDSSSVRSALRGSKPRVVFHLAGGRIATPSLTANLATNVLPTSALIDALDADSLEAFVLASTGEVYGPQPGPFHESLATLPATIYAASKAAAEAFVVGATGGRGLPGIIARMSVVYGPGPWASENGTRSASGMLLPQLIAAARIGKPFPMSAGTQTRDFIYVEDAVRALIELSRTPEATGQIVNVGVGHSVAIATAAVQLLELLGKPIPLEIGAIARRKNEILDYRFDVSRLDRLTRFSPRWTLDRGLREMASAFAPLP